MEIITIMEYTEELKDWIIETVDHYFLKMYSVHQPDDKLQHFDCYDVNVILDKETMQLFEKSWTEWAIKNGYEPYDPIPYEIEELEDGIHTILGAMHMRVQEGKFFILMWLNLDFFHNLYDLQYTIVHELIHLEYGYGIEHGPKFDALVDLYLNHHAKYK